MDVGGGRGRGGGHEIESEVGFCIHLGSFSMNRVTAGGEKAGFKASKQATKWPSDQ